MLLFLENERKIYRSILSIPYVMRCAIWYHLYNLKNMKNTQGGVLILVKLQAETHHIAEKPIDIICK